MYFLFARHRRSEIKTLTVTIVVFLYILISAHIRQPYSQSNFLTSFKRSSTTIHTLLTKCNTLLSIFDFHIKIINISSTRRHNKSRTVIVNSRKNKKNKRETQNYWIHIRKTASEIVNFGRYTRYLHIIKRCLLSLLSLE